MLDGDESGWLADLRRGDAAVWLSRRAASDVKDAPISRGDVQEAADRLQRFAPLLARLFDDEGWDGRIVSPLLTWPAPHGPLPSLLLKADHALPMTGSIKARGGVHDLLAFVERIALDEGLVRPGDRYEALAQPVARETLSLYSATVASTGNLGYSVGLVARRLGLGAEIHMSSDAKSWKKDRLRALDAKVVEHECDYTETVARARIASGGARRVHFVDDETSSDLFTGYAAAAVELRDQLAERGVRPTASKPLVVYLPCGVGGAPGGVLYGLKALLGEAVIGVFVEPVASACFLAAMGAGGGKPLPVYELGLDNRTLADGLAVPVASALVLEAVGDAIDACVAVTDAAMIECVRLAHTLAGLRLEPSAAAGLAAVEPFMRAARERPDLRVRVENATHVVWTTGGSQLPQAEFESLLKD
ncbi:D-serine ammonia-lyase [Caulobacter segnis]|uniref:D-serine ammonia-lyase n=1 Tax=Caulobacter segnis TaxID=88688 RepID=UPI00240EF479|nr:D-serine ammonia-lyase [Caulobacter segnis]MDG2521213.1 D-serine ammonia-lyase [Caulobacter segnis]